MISIWMLAFLVGTACSEDSLKEYSQAARIFENIRQSGQAESKKVIFTAKSPAPADSPSSGAPASGGGADSIQTPPWHNTTTLPPQELVENSRQEDGPQNDGRQKKKESFVNKFAKFLPWALISAMGGVLTWLAVELIKAVAASGGVILAYSIALASVLVATGILLLAYFLITKKLKKIGPKKKDAEIPLK
ncbi:MAG: hypothetical protein HY747_09600 [Elusimicrobia bacterium]|nr:hypothetical protein [Elusimicrobiota bacterium]